MLDQNNFKFTNAVVIAPLVSVILIWTVFLIEIRMTTNFNDFGVYPRTLKGIRGVLLSPFIHGSLQHLYNNTIPLVVLLSALFYFYRQNALKILLVGILMTGLITWAIGRPSYHIGASGVIYLLASFIFFKGILAKYYRLIALSLVVVFIYGSLLWYVFPIKEGISWEGHLAGFLTGLFLAILIKSRIPTAKKFAWERDDYNEEDDEFLKHFDEDGNFIESIDDDLQEESDAITFTYQFKKGNNSDL